MDHYLSTYEENNRKKGRVISIVINTILLALIFLPFMTYQDPPPGQEGVTVNLGIPDIGSGDDGSTKGEPEPTPAPAEPEPIPDRPEPEPEPVEPPPPAPEPEPQPEPKPEPQVEKPKVRTESPEAIALRKKQEEAKRKKRQEELERQREQRERERKIEEQRRQREAEARRKAEEEARRKAAEAERKRRQGDLGGLFNDGGSGTGNTNTGGTQGDPSGEPNRDVLTGTSSGGAGQIGGGLASRGVVSNPKVNDNSNKRGTVVLDICVDANGNVTKAEYKMGGSTTSDTYLVNIAKRNAKQWKFKKSSVPSQCGTIKYFFEVQ